MGDDAVVAHNSYAALKQRIDATYKWLSKFLDYQHPKILLSYLSNEELDFLRAIKAKITHTDVSKKNVGLLKIKELDVKLESDLFTSISGRDKLGIDKGIEVEYNPNGSFKGKDFKCNWDGTEGPATTPRYADTEKKLLEDLDDRLQKKGANSNTSGLVEIHTELIPCKSCTKIIEEFNIKYPNIKLVVKTHEKSFY